MIGASNASGAGFKTRNFDLKVPSVYEMKIGIPSEYRIDCSNVPQGVTFKVSVEGTELKRGVDILVSEETGTWSGIFHQ
jgi:hypothetical protein